MTKEEEKKRKTLKNMQKTKKKKTMTKGKKILFGINDCHKPKVNRKKTYVFQQHSINKRKISISYKRRKRRRNYHFKHVILFPHDLGQTKHGVDKAPSYLQRHFCKHAQKNNNNLKIRHVKTTKDDLFENLRRLYDQNDKIKERKINIGGDHSMSIATIAQSINQYPSCKVIYFDAHADINTLKSSHSKHYHGMPLSFVTGIDKNVQEFPFIQQHLPFQHLLYIGSRCWDVFERNFIYTHNIAFIDPSELNNNYLFTLQKILDFVDGHPVHLSFDVDSMDKSIVPSTGTAVSGGINLQTGKQILQDLKQYTNIINVDITELNLALGTKEEAKISAETTMKIFQPFLCFS